MDLLHSHASAFDFALFVFTYIERISNTVCNKNLLKHFLSRFTDLFYLLKMKCIILFEPVADSPNIYFVVHFWINIFIQTIHHSNIWGQKMITLFFSTIFIMKPLTKTFNSISY